MRDETRKILGMPDLPITTTCIRVPVVSSHSVIVHATFARKVRVNEARQALVEAPTIVVLDDPDEPEFPTPNDVVGADPRFAGRIRQAPDAPMTLDLFISGDNLRKGAALNMVQTAELVARDLVETTTMDAVAPASSSRTIEHPRPPAPDIRSTP